MNILKARKLMAEKFLADLKLRNNFELLILMVQLTYLQELWFAATETKLKDFATCDSGRIFQHLFGRIYSHKCRKAFLDKLVEVTDGDKNVVLAFISLRGWWRIRAKWLLEGSCGHMWDKSDSTEKFVDGLDYQGTNAIKSLTPKYFQLPDHGLEKWDIGSSPSTAYVAYLNNLRSQYEFAVAFDSEIQIGAMNKLVSGLETFGAFRQLYGSGQHGGTIGVTLLTLGCRLATTTEELTLVTRWLFNAKRSEAEHLKKHLKPLLKKLIATL